jgi:hypothetical protein
MRQAGMDVSTDEAVLTMLSTFASFILPLQQFTDGAFTSALLVPGVFRTAGGEARVEVRTTASSSDTILQVEGRVNNATLQRTDIPAGKVGALEMHFATACDSLFL